MTAPALNLPIISTLPGGASTGVAGQGAAAGAGQGPMAGFEALLAGLFGGQGGDLLGAGKAEAAEGSKDAVAAPDDQTTPATSTEAMVLAAMLAVPAAPQAQTPADSTAEGKGLSADGKPKAEPAIAFTAPPVQAAPTRVLEGPVAPPAEQPAASRPSTDGATLEAALAAAIEGEPETPMAAEDAAKPASAVAPDLKPATPEAPKLPHQPHAAQPAPQAKAPEPLQAPAPVETAAEPAPEIEAQAAPAPAAEPPTPRAATKSAKPGEAQRRDPEFAAAQPTVDDAVSPVAVKPVAGPSGEAALPLDQDAPAAAPTAREAKAEARPDAPDFQPAAPAAPQAAQAAAPHAQPVRATSETVANLTAQVAKKLEGRATRFDVQLTPAGLGHVSVSVEIAASGKMSAAMSFETPQAAAEVRARSHELQRALEQAGFDLTGGLSFDVAGDRGDGRGQAQQQHQQSDGAAWRGRAFQAVLGTAGEVVENASSLALNYGRRSATGVDVRI